MATRAEIITQIQSNVTEVLRDDVSQTRQSIIERPDGSKTEIEYIPCLITGSRGGERKVDQVIYVKYDTNGNEVEAWLDDDIKKNYVASTREAELLAKFNAIETAAGTVKVDPKSLDTLGIPYLVFEAGGVKNVTVTLDGQSITREAI